ncbi:MAG TPA: hypothetical protein VMV61_01945 [Patescibacteria group bacterium]|nr:hypothetical protein [Patescibacteria group bacterium]
MRDDSGMGRSATLRRVWPIFAGGALTLACLCATAQNDNPLTPSPPRAVRNISREAPPAPPPPLPPEKIIETFATHEDDYLRANTMYGFKRSIRIQEFDPNGQQSAETSLASQVYLADNGKRYERATQPNSQRMLDTKSGSIDAEKAAAVPLFPFISGQMKYYDLVYKGSQPLDELHTYIFQVKPKRLLSNYRLFSGLIYVDDQDLAIVKLYGKWVSLNEGDEDSSVRDSPFTLYEMYYENVDGRYWFPTYIRSEAYVHTKDGDYHLRLTVRMTDFKVSKPVAAPGETGNGPGPGGPPAPPANPQKPAESPTKPSA